MKEEKNTRFGKNGICVLRALRYCGEKNALCNALFFCNEFLFYLLFFHLLSPLLTIFVF
jgi:hypothetical protein